MKNSRSTSDTFSAGSRTYTVSVYDNAGKTFDRYTVVFDNVRESRPGTYMALGLSEHPGHPQGFSQFTSAMKGSHLGKKISFHQLPDTVRRHVIARMSGLT